MSFDAESDPPLSEFCIEVPTLHCTHTSSAPYSTVFYRLNWESYSCWRHGCLVFQRILSVPPRNTLPMAWRVR